MKIYLLSIIIVGCLFGSGCYYSQPNRTYGSSGINATTGAAALAGAAGGAYVGNQLNKEYGAPLGAAVGGLAAGGITAIIQQRQQRELQEAYADGQRKGMSLVFDEWWTEHAIMVDPLAEAHDKGPKTRQIPQPAGVYESVPYHKRTYPYIIKAEE